MHPNLRAFLAMLTVSELGPELVAASDRGYNVIVGSTAAHPILFPAGYADHPRRIVEFRDKKDRVLKSTAAGAYQILARYFDAYKKELGLKDFSPFSQDLIAIKMIREQHAYDDVLAGRFASAVDKCRNIWASLPGAGYSQNEHTLAYLQGAFAKAGGVLA
jgi:muramidase (phage lysozyme)